ncbi:cytochrome P450 4c3-like isoform X1 [Daphnia pulex]|uniref:cytochrome P450 4c3-like isoform X1 n=1 Tax=Daphnia pulex TaxID=6669 RepID=UPI001EDF33E6|nr:cytochrome P450 4c3-like isoform X1 [Daphnia pulex]XP_046451577.1 cytochrome P450 4c3-like isoform X1 [Daphnia pulex]
MVMTIQALHFALEWFTTPSNVTLFSLMAIFSIFVLVALIKRVIFVKRINRIPGLPCGITIIGNAPTFLVPPEEILNRLTGYVAAMQSSDPVLRSWAGPFPFFILFTAESFEVILSSRKLIDKSRDYNYLKPWLNTGLLTSTGRKWFERRKMLTPTFHFKILEDFVQVFNEQSQNLIQQLHDAIKLKNEIDVYPFITRCTLDIICDTAMGCNVDAQAKSDSEYVKAVYTMSEIVAARQSRPWIQPNILFQMSEYSSKQRKVLCVLHSFTDDVIRRSKMERMEQNTNKITTQYQDDDSFVAKKKRLALLDLLLDASKNGEVLSDLDIREEVDTFMFEGHDTTTAAINWSLLLIGSYPQVQERLNEELDRVFGGSDRPATMADLSELKYLECCIKEALRLYPSVPIIGRKLNEDTVIHGYTLPANTTVGLMTYILHRDPKNFPDPELYQPERFFETNSRGRHPYAYVPFSAGPRNCIGQKFALMEEKVILSSIFRNFHIKALDKREELILLIELILRPRNGIRLLLTPKQKD